MTVPAKALSPSQIKTFARCRRRWGFRYIDGIKVESNAYATYGKEGHRQLENWFLKGVPPNPKTKEGQSAISGLHHWPAPQYVVAVEAAITTATCVSAYHGFQDLEAVDPGVRISVCGDHKFVGSFDWMLNEETLKADIQANIYGRAQMERRGVDRLEYRWVYYQRIGPKTPRPRPSRKVSLVVYREDVERQFQKTIDPIASDIHEAYATYRAGKDLPPNPKACDDFGGCDYREMCEISFKERIEALMSQETLRDKLMVNRGINPPEAGVVVQPGVVQTQSPLDEIKARAANAALHLQQQGGNPLAGLQALQAQAAGQPSSPLTLAGLQAQLGGQQAPANPLAALQAVAGHGQPNPLASLQAQAQAQAQAQPNPLAALQAQAAAGQPQGLNLLEQIQMRAQQGAQQAQVQPQAQTPAVAANPLAGLQAQVAGQQQQVQAQPAAGLNILEQIAQRAQQEQQVLQAATSSVAGGGVMGASNPLSLLQGGTVTTDAQLATALAAAQAQQGTGLLATMAANAQATEQRYAEESARNAAALAASAAAAATGAQQLSMTQQIQAQAHQPIPVQTSAQTLAQASQSVSNATPRVLTILINCRIARPVNARVHLAADIAEKANALVCSDMGVSHYSFVDFKSRGALVVAVHRVLSMMLETGEIQPGDAISLFTSDRTEADAQEAFVAFGATVIRS